MAAGMDTMMLTGLAAPTLGAEERSDEGPRVGASASSKRPDPEVLAKPKRRRFTAPYRLRILAEAGGCTEPGHVGRLLRPSGRYRAPRPRWRQAPP